MNEWSEKQLVKNLINTYYNVQSLAAIITVNIPPIQIHPTIYDKVEDSLIVILEVLKLLYETSSDRWLVILKTSPEISSFFNEILSDYILNLETADIKHTTIQ